MRILSTFIIVFICFILSAVGAPGGSGPQGITKKRPKSTPPGRALRPLLPAPKNKTVQYNKEHVEKLLEQFTLLLCVHRMLYKDFAGISWVGVWSVPSENLKTLFALSVTKKCAPLVLPFVQERANWVLDQPPKTWDEARFILNLCEHRCNPNVAVNFGGIQFNGVWPRDDPAMLRCNHECKMIYGSLLNEVPGDAVPAGSGGGNEEVTKAIGVVQKTITKLNLGDAKRATGRRMTVDQTSLRIDVLKKLHEEKGGPS
ncbi:hypothetical protein F5887DRAFT_1077610 [Amanita rubescens]|nr:hypothetical protein F5887DRAFT_1077610 [Amanita rubescens]